MRRIFLVSTLMILVIMLGSSAILSAGEGSTGGVFPRVAQANYDDLQQPRWLHGDLGNLGVSSSRMADLRNIKELAQAYLDDRMEALRLTELDELQIVSAITDKLGMIHVRIRQLHFDLPVDGADLWIHIRPDGVVETINGFLGGEIQQLPVADINSKEKVSTVLRLRLSAQSLQLLEEPVLVYRARPDHQARLAWRCILNWSDDQGMHQDRVYLDARNGQILSRIGMLHDSLYRKVYNGNQSTSMPGTLLFTEGGSSSDQVAMAAYNNTGTTYNFYQTVFGRDSYDGSGAQIPSTVHHVFNDGYGGTTPNNAAWSDYYKAFMFGDGDGTNFAPLSYALDVTAHELTHAVTSSTANLEYSNESGAVNEMMSDIMGTACEAWHDGAISANTWKMGEAVYTPNTEGDALRYINDPAADGSSPDYYPDRYTGTNDYGGVHINMCIGTLAFYLMSEGGTHPRGKTTVNVPGIGIEKAEKIYYRALTHYMTTSTNYEGARNATAQAATELYGSTEEAAVQKAWDAVGVPGGSSSGGGDTELNNGDHLTGLGASQGADLNFFMNVPSGSSNLVFQMTGGTGDADIYVRYGSKPTSSTYDFRPYLNGNEETVTIAAPQTGTYYVMIHAYSTFSGLTLNASYDSAASNVAPTAGFTVSTNDLSASFHDTSSDSDGSVTAWSWSFGDGASSTSQNPSHTYASAGSYTVSLTVTDNGGATDGYSASVSVTAPASGPGELNNGSAVSNLSAAKDASLEYFITVPTGASNLEIKISGGSGDADLYVRRGSAPTTSSYDFRPYLNGNNETVTVSSPQGGDWYIMVRAYAAFSGVTLLASYDNPSTNTAPTAHFSSSISDLTASFTDSSSDSDGSVTAWSWSFGDGASSTLKNPSHTYSAAGTYMVSLTVTDNGGLTDSYSANVTVTEPPGGGGSELSNGVPVSSLSAAKNEELNFTMEVPSGASNLVFAMSGGTGDADIYIRYGSAPTTSSYDYRPYETGNNETVNVSTATAGTWYIMIRAYAAFSGVTLEGSYDGGSSGGGTQTGTATGSVDGHGEKLYNLTVSGGTIDLSLTWDNSNDLDLYLYNPSGTEVAKGISTNKPETLSYDTNGTSGTYQIKVYNYSSSGTANFTLTATYQQ